MTYKFCKYCKKKFTKEDILKSLPVEKHKNINMIWGRRKYCSDECAQKGTRKNEMKNRKFIAITYEVDKMICEVGMMKDTYSDVIKKLFIYYNSEGKKRTGLKRKPQQCACGCGEMTKPGNKYILGHN